VNRIGISWESSRRKNPWKKCSKIRLYLARLSFFPEIIENAVQFPTGNFQKLKLEISDGIERTPFVYDSLMPFS